MGEVCKIFYNDFAEERGRHMVPLREVEKPIAGIKKMKKVERHEELQSKFSKLSEEERMLNTLDADKKKVIFSFTSVTCQSLAS